MPSAWSVDVVPGRPVNFALPVQKMFVPPLGVKSKSSWWPPGHVIGYEHTFVHTVNDFVNAVATNTDVHADFLDGAKCVAVLESVVASKKEKGWVKVQNIR